MRGHFAYYANAVWHCQYKFTLADIVALDKHIIGYRSLGLIETTSQLKREILSYAWLVITCRRLLILSETITRAAIKSYDDSHSHY